MEIFSGSVLTKVVLPREDVPLGLYTTKYEFMYSVLKNFLSISKRLKGEKKLTLFKIPSLSSNAEKLIN